MTSNDNEASIVDRLKSQYWDLIGDLRNALDFDAGLAEFHAFDNFASLAERLRGALDLDAGLREVFSAESGNRPAAYGLGLSTHGATSARTLISVRGDSEARSLQDMLHQMRRLAVQPNNDELGRTMVSVFGEDSGFVGAFDNSLGRGLAIRRSVFAAVDLYGQLREVAKERRALTYLGTSQTLRASRSSMEVLVRGLDEAVYGTPRSAEQDELLLVSEREQDITSIIEGCLARDQELIQTCELAHWLADNLDELGNGAIGFLLDIVRNVATALDRALSAQLGVLLPGIKLEPLVPQQIHRLLDDFTQSDLSEVDFTSADIAGLFWSEATVWPSPMIAEEMRRISMSIVPGIYEVRKDGNLPIDTLALA